jgi:hypothetical protein
MKKITAKIKMMRRMLGLILLWNPEPRAAGDGGDSVDDTGVIRAKGRIRIRLRGECNRQDDRT